MSLMKDVSRGEEGGGGMMYVRYGAFGDGEEERRGMKVALVGWGEL